MRVARSPHPQGEFWAAGGPSHGSSGSDSGQPLSDLFRLRWKAVLHAALSSVEEALRRDPSSPQAPMAYELRAEILRNLGYRCRRQHHRSSMTSSRGWEQQINSMPSAGRSSGSGW
jgi:hypothetical protein